MLSKIAWAIIAPGGLLLLFVLFLWVMLWRGRVRLARLGFSVFVAILLALSIFPVGEWLLSPLEARFPGNPALPGKIDGIIVLGGAEDAVLSAHWKQVEVNDASERILAFLVLARRYPQAKLVFSGGSGAVLDQQHRSADIAKILFTELGLDVSRITFERESRNTYENVVLSKSLANPHRGEKWILITSAFHMPRSVGIFCKAEWPVIPYPVDHRTMGARLFRPEISITGHFGDLNIGLREWLGLLAYYATGKTAQLLPVRCDQ